MNFFTSSFYFLFYQPLLNALVFLYCYCHDFGLSIIILTFLIRLLLTPLSLHALKSQKSLSLLQPKIEEAKEKFKKNPEAQAKAIMQIYKEAKVNPFSGFFVLLLQLPILLALYRVFLKGLFLKDATVLYPFLRGVKIASPSFLGLIDLSKGNFLLALLAAIFQYFQTKLTTPQKNFKKKEAKEIIQTEVNFFLSFFTFLLLLKWPSAVALYWVVSALFSIVQQYYVGLSRN